MCTYLRRVAAIAALATLLLTGCGLTKTARDAATAARELPELPELPDVAVPEEVPDVPDRTGVDTPDDAAPADGQPDSGGTSSVCELLTPGEIEDGLGQSVEVETSADSICTYTTTGTDVLDRTDVTLTILRPINGPAEPLIRGAESGAGTGFDSERIDGMGDGAVLITGGPMTMIGVKADDAWVTLTVMGPDQSSRSRETVTQLMDLVVQRLT